MVKNCTFIQHGRVVEGNETEIIAAHYRIKSAPHYIATVDYEKKILFLLETDRKYILNLQEQIKLEHPELEIRYYKKTPSEC
ncbi:MAG: hypothetical protein IJ309_02360 [Clostridia bacterium]|nr:hypothetical protein [Clostridia bacterium]